MQKGLTPPGEVHGLEAPGSEVGQGVDRIVQLEGLTRCVRPKDQGIACLDRGPHEGAYRRGARACDCTACGGARQV